MSTNDTLEPGVGNPQELREVCLAHLKLIHKMSEAILAKDRQIKHLKETNRQV
jgi:hypothetical protein